MLASDHNREILFFGMADEEWCLCKLVVLGEILITDDDGMIVVVLLLRVEVVG